jgi:hypothetical protein
MKYLLMTFSLAFLFSCLKENKIVLKNDFEKPQTGWGKDNILKGDAHSGQFYTRTDDTHQFSSGFSRRISEITNHKIKRIDVATWIRKTDNSANADFVVSLDRGADPVFWKTIQTREGAPEINEWTRLFASYDLPDSLGNNENLKVYIWNINKYPIEADDFEIRLYY